MPEVRGIMKKYIITEEELKAVLYHLKNHSLINARAILNELEELKEDEHTRVQTENKKS